jgi:uncharacterized protein YejL (UPF0352 family)
MPTLRSNLNAIANSFANAVLEAVRGASVEELLGNNTNHRPVDRSNGSTKSPARAAPSRSSGRLARRSTEDIAALLDKIMALVKKHKGGLRAEQIRIELKMQSKEMPRVLKEGLSTKRLKTKGQKRATTYFAV